MNETPKDKKVNPIEFTIGVVGSMVIFGLTIADFLNDGNVAREWIAACILIIFGFTGRALDSSIWNSFRRRN